MAGTAEDSSVSAQCVGQHHARSRYHWIFINKLTNKWANGMLPANWEGQRDVQNRQMGDKT